MFETFFSKNDFVLKSGEIKTEPDLNGFCLRLILEQETYVTHYMYIRSFLITLASRTCRCSKHSLVKAFAANTKPMYIHLTAKEAHNLNTGYFV